ncbi:MAG: hypothetical protein WAP51_03935 [Candidatus Sungiibacteriota bacterium]
MILKKQWSNWQVFLTSVVIALAGTPLVAPLYSELFYVGGGFFVPSSYDSNTMTFLLLYTFFFSVIYLAFGKNPRSTTATQLLSVPTLIFLFTWDMRLIAWIIVLIFGLVVGSTARQFLVKSS